MHEAEINKNRQLLANFVKEEAKNTKLRYSI